MANETYWPDIEADAHRFYGWWVDMEALQFPDIPTVRLIQMLERLPCYGGALTMAAKQEISEQEGAGGGGPHPSAPSPVPGLPEPTGKGPVRRVDSNPAVLALDPAMAGLFEFSAV